MRRGEFADPVCSVHSAFGLHSVFPAVAGFAEEAGGCQTFDERLV